MIYNVAHLMKSAPGTTHDDQIDGADANAEDLRLDDAEAVGAATGRVRLNRTNLGVYADATVSIPTRLQCARCLKDFTTTLTFPVREEFFPTIDILTGAPMQAEHSEDAFPIDLQHELDMREAIRQNFLLALPSRALCREDCAGLCPQCGHDLNDGPCGCVAEPLDDRFSALRGLFADEAAGSAEDVSDDDDGAYFADETDAEADDHSFDSLGEIDEAQTLDDR